MTENERRHLIEGYKSLTQYGCQMSQDHISTDRVMMPLSLAPALWVLAPPNGPIDGKLAETLILLGGTVFIVFWMLRNWRSGKRLHAIWDILRLIEVKLGFETYLILDRFMDGSLFIKGRPKGQSKITPPRDFTLKKWFGWAALAFYGLVFVFDVMVDVWRAWLCFNC